MAKLLLGKEVTAALNAKLQARVAELKEKGVTPKLGIVRCGENPSDLSYEKGATARAELIGVEVEKFVLPEDVTKNTPINIRFTVNDDGMVFAYVECKDQHAEYNLKTKTSMTDEEIRKYRGIVEHGLI